MPFASIDLVSRHSDVLFWASITCPNLTALKTQWTAPKMLTWHLNEWTYQTHQGGSVKCFDLYQSLSVSTGWVLYKGWAM